MKELSELLGHLETAFQAREVFGELSDKNDCNSPEIKEAFNNLHTTETTFWNFWEKNRAGVLKLVKEDEQQPEAS